MNKLQVRIIKPAGVAHEFIADMAVMPGSEGEFGVMYDHVPMVVQLKEGEVKVHSGSEIKTIQIGAGVVMISNTSVDVVCDS